MNGWRRAAFSLEREGERSRAGGKEAVIGHGHGLSRETIQVDVDVDVDVVVVVVAAACMQQSSAVSTPRFKFY